MGQRTKAGTLASKLVALALTLRKRDERDCLRAGRGDRPDIPDRLMVALIMVSLLHKKKTKSRQFRFLQQRRTLGDDPGNESRSRFCLTASCDQAIPHPFHHGGTLSNHGPAGPKGDAMLRWGIVLAAAVVLGLATEARAQLLPRGNDQVQFAPIDVTKNLATPIPTVVTPQPKGSYFDRLYDALAKVLPFPKRNRQPNLGGPLVPVMQLPKSVQAALPQPQQPTTKLPSLPSLPTLFSGAAK